MGRFVRQIVVLVLALAHAGLATANESPDGRTLYLRQCGDCHGATGHGDGPDAALFLTRPRDLRDSALQSRPTAQLVREILDGAHHAISLDASMLRSRQVDTESLIAYLRQLPDINWSVVDAGQRSFVDQCAPCHGSFGRPGTAVPPGVRRPRDLSDASVQRSMTDDEVMIAVRHGRAGMPALTPRVSEAAAAELAAFVRLLSPGYVTYAQVCAQCHGDHGVAVGSLGESFAVPTVIFDRAYFARQDPEALRVSVWHMLEQHQPAMPHFRGALSEKDAEAIVRYLKQLPSDR